MAEEYTCIQCERLYDNTDGDTDERMCYRCLTELYGDGEPTTADLHNNEMHPDDTRPIRNIVRYNFAAYSVKLKQQKEKDDESKS
tara:strand:+ start:1541 stop:1795 length:255 start_codon:yes stop_codon:yes gene_type:complete